MSPERTFSPLRDARRGFGLAEQIIAVAILAVLASIAIPSFHHIIERQELRAAQTDYIAALQHARNLAINEQRQMIFCASRDGQRCNGDGNWSGGWLIGRHDLDKPGQPQGSALYTGGQHYSEKVVITGSDAKKYVAYKTDGSLAGSNQTLSFCVRDEPKVLKVVIAPRGRVRGEVATATDTSPCADVN